VARRCLAHSSVLGGGDVPTSGSARTRLATAVAALGLAVALAVPPTVGAGGGTRVLVALAAIGLLAVVGALLWTVRFLTWALLAFGAEYTVSWWGSAVIAVWAAPVGAGLLVLAELVQWSISARSPSWERWMDLRRIVDLAVIWVGATSSAAFVLVVASIPARGGVWLSALGAAAASGALGLVLLLARRDRLGNPLASKADPPTAS
jgi:hypothetical protein